MASDIGLDLGRIPLYNENSADESAKTAVKLVASSWVQRSPLIIVGRGSTLATRLLAIALGIIVSSTGDNEQRL